MRVGIYVFAVASIAAGVINLIWHDFALGWQPITAFGDAVPGRELLAIVTATWLVIAGLALLWRRSAAGGAIALGVVYAVFAIFWLPRLYWIVRLYGFSPAHLIGVLDGFCQQAILVCAAIIIWAFSEASSRAARIVRLASSVFGASCIIFGVGHYVGIANVAALVPRWLPPGGAFWAILTGTAFVLAGLAISFGILDVLAARLLAAMLLVFSALVCFPWIIQDPRGHEAWAGNAYNLAAAASAWIVAGWLARQEAAPRRWHGP